MDSNYVQILWPWGSCNGLEAAYDLQAFTCTSAVVFNNLLSFQHFVAFQTPSPRDAQTALPPSSYPRDRRDLDN